MTMENNEQIPQPVEKPQEPVHAAQPVSAENPECQASVKQEVCNEKAGTVNESP